MAKAILCCVFLFFGCITTAQILPFKTYTTKDGLIDDNVTSIIKDDRGLLWIGTHHGISWFDGTRFYQPSIQARTGQLFVTRFFKDFNGDMWVLTFYNGIYKYTYGGFYNYVIDENTIIAGANNVFDMMQFDSNKYLVATDRNVYWFDGKKFLVFDGDNKQLNEAIYAVVKFKDASVLLGTKSGIWMYSFDKSTKQISRFLEGHEISNIDIVNDEIWISTSKGLYHYKNKNDFVLRKPSKVYLPGQRVANVLKTNKDLWITSDKVYRIHKDQLLTYESKNGLSGAPVYYDPTGIMWFGSANGFSRLISEHYKFHDLSGTGIYKPILCLEVDKQSNVWLGNYVGIVKKKNDRYLNYTSYSNNRIGYTSWLLNTTKGTLLAGTTTGIFELAKNEMRKKINIATTKAYQDNKGIIWLGTENGELFMLMNNSLLQVSLNEGVQDYIDGLYRDKDGYLWVGYRGYGLIKYRMNGLRADKVEEFTAKTGFTDLRIRCSAADRNGNVLFGTRTNGLFIFSSKENGKFWHINYSKGLSANWVKSISVDDKNNIYMATSKGVNVLNGSDYNNAVIRKLRLSNDNAEKPINFVLCRSDTVWIATDGGYYQYFPSKDAPDSTHPKIYLTQLSINGKMDSAFVPFSNSNKALRLPHTKNVVEFEFAGIYHKTGELRYSYMLAGQDKNWSNPGERNFVSYNLPPGNYAFKVKSINENGVTSLQPATFMFSIDAPFWRTTWFILLCFFSASAIIYIIYRYRIAQIIKLEKIRSRISSDLHDDIGSTLSSISILSEVALQETDKLQSRNMVKEIKESSIVLMEKMDDIIWSVNPKNDSLENLMIRIKRFAAQLFEAKNIDYTLDIDDSIGSISLPMEYRQQIYLIMKEAINNIVKHSRCSYAAIEMRAEQNILQVRITDNGKGFNASRVHSGNGLLSMRSRAEHINADLKITTAPGQGTSILLRSKIK